MKKALMLLFAAILLCGCGAEPTPSPAESGTTAGNVQSEHTTAPSKTVSESTPQPTGESTAPAVQEGELITAERAQEIAFEKAGVTRAEVTRLECELDYDDDRGRREYEIEFNVGAAEYNCEVDAQSGEVVEFYKDRD